VNFTDQGLKGVKEVPNGKTSRAIQQSNSEWCAKPFG
jgi:hypothetical protein